MNQFDRRQFLEMSAAALMAARASDAQAEEPSDVTVSDSNGTLRITGANYAWEWNQADDQFRLLDRKGLLIVTARVQPVVVVSARNKAGSRRVSHGTLASHEVHAKAATFHYEGVNGHARLSTTWKFGDRSIQVEPVVYESAVAEDVVSVHYFAKVRENEPVPELRPSFLIHPGITEGSSISPVVPRGMATNDLSWLGRGGPGLPGAGLQQQWGLPVDYFCGFNINRVGRGTRDIHSLGRSEAFCCGLSELPSGDFLLNLRSGAAGVIVNYRSDLWGHLRGPGQMLVGARLFWAFGPNYYQAIRAYYLGLMKAGFIRRKTNSAKKTAAALTPQFCSWGAQVARGKTGDRLDETFLRGIYKELRESGMRVGMFSIDDKWQHRYGTLEHSARRFPHFTEFLDHVRADGLRIGLWAAFMRCEDPNDVGLTEENMLRQPDGKSYKAGGGRYFILDFTQPKVAQVMVRLAQNFMRRYKPDLVKFDFGYELPSVDIAGPADKHWAGERLMWKGLDVVVRAMRDVNPDVVVMYYQLSPLFLDFIDLHSPDDLFLCPGEYDLEANRRFFFSSLCGTLGVPTYGSSGYDWQSAPSIWFDSTVVGTLGSLNDFQGDERGEHSTPARIARYNGLTHVLRQSNTFQVVPLDAQYTAAARGASSRSWARLENGKVVLMALRPDCQMDRAASETSAEEARLKGMVHTTVPVVVSSRTRDSLDHADALALVPCGDGEVSIRRAQGREAEITEHWFGGASSKGRVPIRDGLCRMQVRSKRESDNTPIEWLDVQIST
jgi:Glycosyl hydrolases family 31 TIM-barrel domain